MTKTPIYTVGYGSRDIAAFTRLLQDYQIRYLIDVRSSPFSKFNPDFCQDELKRRLALSGIKYVFMGDELGGHPRDESCYTDGKVDYGKCKDKPFYLKGIERLRTAWDKQLRVAVMCSEGKPQDCHRSKLIGETLTAMDISVEHIDESGNLKTQQQVIETLLGNQLSFFDQSFTSRKRYRKPAARDGE